MHDELKNISERMSLLIGNDDFPNRVQPDYLQTAMRAYPLQGGKRIRPAMMLWSCGLLGGNLNKIDYYAAAIEVWHNWTLVHDDIIDGDLTRRGNPATHRALASVATSKFALPQIEADKYGTNMAILCGDLQQSWAISLVLKGQKKYNTSSELILEMIAKIQALAAVELISGEALDVELAIRNINEITPCDVMEMIDLKTGALFRAACEIGAALALDRFDAEEVKELGDFASAMGLAFQLQDDLLGTFGDFSELGKDIGSDLRERKPTILLLKTLELASEDDRTIIVSMLGKSDLSILDLELVKSIMINCGAYDYVDGESQRLTRKALEILEKFPDNKYRRYFSDLLNYLLNRQL